MKSTPLLTWGRLVELLQLGGIDIVCQVSVCDILCMQTHDTLSPIYHTLTFVPQSVFHTHAPTYTALPHIWKVNHDENEISRRISSVSFAPLPPSSFTTSNHDHDKYNINFTSNNNNNRLNSKTNSPWHIRS